MELPTLLGDPSGAHLYTELISPASKDRIILAAILGSKRRPTSKQIKTATLDYYDDITEALGIDDALDGRYGLRWSKDGRLVPGGLPAPRDRMLTASPYSVVLFPSDNDMMLPLELEALYFALAGGEGRAIDLAEMLALQRRVRGARLRYTLWLMVLRGEIVVDVTYAPSRFELTSSGRALAASLSGEEQAA